MTKAPSKLILTRYHFDETFTSGILTLDGKFVCYTVEDKVRELRSKADKIPGKTAIPAGTYKIVVNMSNRFKREMIQLLNVPYFEGIRMHGGNTHEDTEGCILVARNFKGLGLIQGTMEKEMTMYAKGGKFDRIEIREAK
jgi:hypothetical protein